MTIREFFDRYGPTVAVLAILGLLAVLVPGNTPKDTNVQAVSGSGPAAADAAGATGAVTDDTTVGAGGETVDTSAGSGAGSTGAPVAGAARAGATAARTPGAAAAGPAAGTGAAAGPAAAGGSGTAASTAKGLEFGVGPNCRPDKRMKQMSTYSPPCNNWVPGSDNGGATARGVSADKIVVVRYINQADPATQAALQAAGATDSPEDRFRIDRVLLKYFNQHTETYGREVVFKEISATGKDENDAAMKSDARKIAEETKAFAVIPNSASGPAVFATELAQLGVLCLCTTSQSESFFAKNPPYIFASLPTLEDYYTHFAEYIGKRLANKKAKYAGDPTGVMQANDRRFGLVYQEGIRGVADPDLRAGRNFFVKELAKYGVTLSADVGYLYDLTKAPNDSQGIISTMVDKKVSNLLFVGDPLTPVFVTKEASRQQYFPEWFISGTLLIDTSFFGRTYDQAQWAHAFGISPLWVFGTNLKSSSGYRAYHHAKPTAPEGEEGIGINVYQAPIQLLMNGIHMAGPNLTADTFAQGIFNLPKTGGKASAPLVYLTRKSPNAIKDFTEVYWESKQTGKDEVNKDGAGILLKAEKGRRYEAGQWPAQDPKVFGDNNGESIFTDDNPPGGPATVPHEEDGHTHDPKKLCLSCP